MTGSDTCNACLDRRRLLAAAGAGTAGLTAAAACGAPPPSTPVRPAPGPLTPLDRVPVGGTTVVTSANGAPVALTRPEAQTVVAHSAVCTHQGCTVAGGQGLTLVCPCHRSTFDAVSGAATHGPARQPLPAVPVRLADGQVVTST